jgi:Cu+-exporting ATPase
VNRPSTNAQSRLDMPVIGMHCAACAVRIVGALKKAPGVTRAAVNFATGHATVDFDPDTTAASELREVVRGTGYDAVLPAPGNREAGDTVDVSEVARDDEYSSTRLRFLVATGLTIPIAVLAMGGHVIPAWEPILHFPGSVWLQLALCTPVLFWAGGEFFRGAWAAARHRAADMNTLVAIGSFSAYAYSVVATVIPEWVSVGETGEHAGHEPVATVGVYFEVAAIIIALILLGRLLEARARSRTGGAIRALIGLAPKTARVERGGVETDVPIGDVAVDDVIRVRPGEKIPVDGTILDSHRRSTRAC